MDERFYNSQNCNAAFQLNWSLSLFSKTGFHQADRFLDASIQTLETDGVRILQWRLQSPCQLQLFLSTRPNLAPSEIVRFTKARLQYQSRSFTPVSFQRNYHICSVGSANATVVDGYVAKQTLKHPMAQERVQQMFREIQYHNPSVQIELPRTNSYGQFIYGLHVVVESQDGWNEVRREVLCGYLCAIQRGAKDKNWLLSRIGILANHIHILLGANAMDSPEFASLYLLNLLAGSQGSKVLFRYSYFVGTIGRYDRGAIWNSFKGEKGERKEE
jgi:REP element-mobilizing transposase RayT